MAARASTPSLSPGAFALGFAMGGFFDGILLHQVLQWHHLLSATGRDLRFQVLADGWFHLAMYVVAAFGLLALARARGDLASQGSAGRLAGWFLIGFGVWHAIDAVLSHWVLGIHRIRMDVESPLLWDLGWLVLFGVAPVACGGALLRRAHKPVAGGPIPALLAALVLASGLQAAQPAASGAVTVVFAADVPPARALAAAVELGGAPVLLDPKAGVFVVTGGAATLGDWIAAGAVYVGGDALAPGCFSWIEATAPLAS